MIKHRPCGECAALVPADSGCPHWRPVGWRSARKRDDRFYDWSAKKRAKEDVAEFQRVTGIET